MQKLLSLKMVLRISTFFILLLFSTLSKAQLQVDHQSLTPEQLVQDVFLGHGVVISNVKFTGTDVAIGQFTSHNTPLQINRGILLTTGKVELAVGPNDKEDAGFAQGISQGDVDLQKLLSEEYSIFDAAVLEFDFIATSSSIQFNYVFASEEYPEWVNSAYNDVFGFFVTGENPHGGDYLQQNIALIPGTTSIVSIDSVNDGVNSNYYINNADGSSIQYDGITKSMKATLEVKPGNIYHIKIAIGDAGDNAYDSGVFLDANSFTSPQCPVGNLNIKPNCAGKETQLDLWDKSDVTLSANCDGNGNISVNLTNTGLGDMAQSAECRTYNFGTGIVTRQNYQLRVGETLSMAASVTNGATLLVQADQTPVNPQYIQTNITVKNCKTGSPAKITNGIVTSPVSVHWDFGDESVSELLNATHAYKRAGNYEVSATLCDTTIKQTIRIDACPSLSLVSVCSDNPASTRRWRIRNPNSHPVVANWQIIGSTQNGEITVPANSDVFFETITKGTNIASLSVDHVLQAIKLSKWYACSGVKCDECISSFSPVPGEKYIVSAWVKEEIINALTYEKAGIAFDFEGSDVRLGPYKAKGAIIDGWQRIEEEFTVPEGSTSITVQLVNGSNSHDVFFDDIRIHPFNSNMKSFVYDPVSLKLMAELDENNYATFYEYDEEGALIRVKKETERGIVTIQESRNNTVKKP